MNIFNNINMMKKSTIAPKKEVKWDDLVIRIELKDYYNSKLKEALESPEGSIILMPYEMYESLHRHGFISDNSIGGKIIHVFNEDYNPFDGEIIPV